MVNHYSEECAEIVNNMKSFLDSETSCNKIVAYTNTQIEKYRNIVQSFFVGKKDELQGIYQALKETKFPYNRIDFIDINLATHMYGEYFQGLVRFVEKISDLRNTDDVNNEKMMNAIIHVKNKDMEFRKSIIGGERNTVSTVDLDNAMINVESLINIYNDFEEFHKCLEMLSGNIQDNKCEKYANTIVAGMKVFIMSFIYYNDSCIREILSTYKNIIKSMEHRTPASGEMQIPKFQLF